MSNSSILKIVADADLFRVAEMFGSLGELVLVPGREIKRSHVLDADALIVRSITPVNKNLLNESSVRFVGSATSGIDHIDLNYLDSREIQFADARGTNANAVVDYCFTALGQLGYLNEERLRSLRVGIIGYGAIGSLFTQKLEALGVSVAVYDPPLECSQTSVRSSFVSKEEIGNCDVISIHTPLTSTGDYPTENLIDSDFLQNLPNDALLINTCRGGVVDEPALLSLLDKRDDLSFVFDVWADEPNVSTELVSKVALATPHIAGYSKESKRAAVSCLRDELVNYFKLASASTNIDKAEIDCGTEQLQNIQDIKVALESSFFIEELSNAFKTAASNKSVEEFFDQARKDLLTRREFRSLSMQGFGGNDFERKLLEALGADLG